MKILYINKRAVKAFRSRRAREKGQPGLSIQEKDTLCKSLVTYRKDERSAKEETYMIKGARERSVGKPDKKAKMYVATKWKSTQVQVHE